MNSYAQLCIVIHTYHYIFELLKAYCTLKVGRWSPCPVLQQPKKEPHPLLVSRALKKMPIFGKTNENAVSFYTCELFSDIQIPSSF